MAKQKKTAPKAKKEVTDADIKNALASVGIVHFMGIFLTGNPSADLKFYVKTSGTAQLNEFISATVTALHAVQEELDK